MKDTASKAPKGRTLKERWAVSGKRSRITCAIVLILYLLFCYWAGSWWGLLVVPFIIDAYITKYVPWTWWRRTKNPTARLVMGWIDAIVFALVAVYFLNQFFFQNYVIPSSSLEKTLLTGDYLLVSKLSYGPRIPQTPLYMPLTQHTMPVIGGKSYLEKPHWDYRRLSGFGHPELNDIVVFNYPSGDTVALAAQDQDFYRLCYLLGDQRTATPDGMRLSETLKPDMPFAEQRSTLLRIYQAGREVIEANEAQFGKIVSRPADRRENYVKRCCGLPGQTLQIRAGKVFLDGKELADGEFVQHAYDVVWRQALDDDTKKELGISNEDLSELYNDERGTMRVPLTRSVKAELEKRGFFESIKPSQAENQWLFPQGKVTGWTTSDYGPLLIPKKGLKLALTLDNLPLYERCIRSYEGNKLEVRNGKIYINDAEAASYTFKLDYYWMMGDNRDRSADSRFWGFVPEDHVVGKPLFIWLSLDPDYGLLSGGLRWKRLFNWVSNIK